MADRYWVGGTGTWNTTSTTNWSATSGGVGGASVPGIADSVFFDQAGTYTVTMTGALTCLDITVSAGTVTFATGTSPTLSVLGSMSLLAGTVWNMTGATTFRSTTTGRTVTTNGTTLSGSVTFFGVGGGWTLGSALTTAGVLTVTAGSFDTGNYNVTSVTFVGTGSTARVISLGSSTVTLQSILNFGTTTALTFNAGTSQINLTSNTATISSSGLTYYNVSFTSLGPTSGTITRSISGANTFNNLTTATGGNGISILSLGGNQTVSGTFTCAGATGVARGFVRSDTFNTVRTITAAAISADDCDFRDITLAGAAAGAAPIRAGNCGGNSGITFPAAKVAYRVGTNTTWPGSSSWALTSGGAGSDDNYPLPQDTAVIDDNTALSGTLATSTINNIGTLDASGRTSAITLSFGAINSLYGDFTLGAGVTVSGTSIQTFSGRRITTFTSAGKTISFATEIQTNSVGNALKLGDAYTSTASVILTSGTLDLVSYSMTCLAFASTGGSTRELGFGSGSINLTSSGTVWNTSTTGLTTGGSRVVNIANNSNTATTVTCGLLPQSSALDFNFTTGTYSLTLTSGSKRSMDFTGFAGTVGNSTQTVYGGVTFSAAATLSSGTQAWTFAATSGSWAITTLGKIIPFPLVFNGSGGTWVLQDALTLTLPRAVTHTNGTLDLNGKTLTVGSSYITGVGTKNLTFNGGTLVCPATTATAFNNTNPTGFTTTAGAGVGGITMAGAGDKTFIGGGSVFNCRLYATGSGNLTVTGSNTFADIDNSRAGPAISVLFAAGSTNTFAAFSMSGTASFQHTIGSATPGSTFTLSKASGTVSVSYCTISDSIATGGATWNAFTTNGNVDGGNNTGWVFAASGSVTVDVTDVSATGAVGTSVIEAKANAPTTGPPATGYVGDVTIAINVSVDVNTTGVSATGSTGDVTISTSSGANVTLTGVEATGSVGTATITAFASTILVGIESTGSVGDTTIYAAANDNPDGVEATGSVGDVTVITAQNTMVDVTGVSADGAVGTPTFQSAYRVTGVSATGSVGIVAISVRKFISVTGVAATGYVSSVNVWSVINDNQTPDWVPVDDTQSGSWSQIVDGNTVVWTDIPT